MANSKAPVVINGILLSDSGPVVVGTPPWFEWLSTAEKFNFMYGVNKFLARREVRRKQTFWYAYRRCKNRVIKAYLGKTKNLTYQQLQKAAVLLTEKSNEHLIQGKYEQETDNNVITRTETSYQLLTKITPPELPFQTISRPRLVDQINSPLNIIHAPSGFGKTTLMNTWKQLCEFPVIWLTLDEHDNNPIHFWNSIIFAFQVLFPEFGKLIRNYLETNSIINSNEIVDLLKRELSKVQPSYPKIGIVLDDFHFINHQEILLSLEKWFTRLHHNLIIVISGNAKFQFTDNLMTNQKIINQIDVNELRFTPKEGLLYLQKFSRSNNISQDNLEKLVHRTEGWATGLALTARAMGTEIDQSLFINNLRGSNSYFQEYFTETVLKHSTPEIEQFLLKTAILNNLNAEVCNAITGHDDGEVMLEHLWQENFFIVKMEGEGVYRYHELFAEMLRSHLSTQYSDKVIRELHKRAAKWYQRKNAFSDAIYHLMTIEAWEEAATLIEDMALRELSQYGEDSRLLRWLQELPEGVVQKHRNLLFAFMRLANFALPQSTMEMFLSYINKSISNKPVTLQTKDERDVLNEITQIRKIWSEGHTFVPPALQNNKNPNRWGLFNQLYLLRPAYRQYLSFPEAPIKKLMEDSQTQENLYINLMAGGVLAKRYLFAGQLCQSERICNQILDYSFRQRGKLPETSSIALEVLSLINLERNQIDLARKYLNKAIEVDPNPLSSNMPIQCLILRAKIQLALRMNDESMETIKKAQELNFERPGGLLTNEDLQAYEALVAVRIGDISLAEKLLSFQPEINEHHLLRQIQAEIYLKSDRFYDAEILLQETINKYSHLIVIEPLMETRVLLALALFEQNKINQALHVIMDSIRIAVPERYIRPFLIGGVRCASLISIAVQTMNLSEKNRNFMKEIIRVSSEMGEIPKISGSELETYALSASITARELEIIALLNEGMSNPKIAAKLLIAETTVKTHLSNIYNKLNVTTRVQAVNRAKNLSIIS